MVKNNPVELDQLFEQALNAGDLDALVEDARRDERGDAQGDARDDERRAVPPLEEVSQSQQAVHRHSALRAECECECECE